VYPGRGIEHRVEDLFFRKLRAWLVVARRQKAAKIRAGSPLLVVVILHPDS
jgi:hypothetical protein